MTGLRPAAGPMAWLPPERSLFVLCLPLNDPLYVFVGYALGCSK
jgi:hypothetical protein